MTELLESFDPTTGEPVGAVEVIEPSQVGAVAAEVGEAQRSWARVGLADRARILRRTADVLLGEMGDVAALVTREQGKPIVESHSMEVMPTIDALHWCAETGRELLADERSRFSQLYLKNKEGRFRFEPIGVVGVISPWNYPWSIAFTTTAMNLMAGNGVVLKPSELTPLVGERIQLAFERGGVPAGLVRCAHGGAEVGRAVCESPEVGKVFFTGSVETGRAVGELCARAMKGAVLELGGKDAQIVCADADVENAAAGCVWGAFANGGQTCAGIERSYVAEPVAERFIAAVVRRAERLRIGDPALWETEVGPLITREHAQGVTELVDDALARGAERLTGGPVEPDGLGGTFMAPTVLTGVPDAARLWSEEVFGPVAPITVVADDDEALARANDSRFGLGASVWTRDRDRGERLAAGLEAGMVWINDHAFTHGLCQCAWGGVKDSGLGQTHSRFGFYECVNVKHVTWGPARIPSFWWYPYDRTLGRALEATMHAIYGRDGRLRAVRDGARPLAELGTRLIRRGNPRP